MNETAPVETLAALCAGESFGRSGGDVHSASAAALERLGQFQSGFVNARKGIVRTWDDVAVERGDLVGITDRVENSSTWDKLEIGQKPEKVFLPLVSYVGSFDLCQFSGEPLPHLAGMGFHGNILNCFAGHTSRRKSVREDCRY